MPDERILTFPSTRTAIDGERALLAAGLDATVMPMPEALSAQCGIVLRLPAAQLEDAKQILRVARVPIAAIYCKQGNAITPYA